jgi:hypothetical protein
LFNIVVDEDFGDYFVALSPIGKLSTPCFLSGYCKQHRGPKYIAGVQDIGDEIVLTIAALFLKVKKLVTLSLKANAKHDFLYRENSLVIYLIIFPLSLLIWTGNIPFFSDL